MCVAADPRVHLVRVGCRARRDAGAGQLGATKSPTTLRETPQSVTVITQESIKDRQVKDINSALELSAGASAYLTKPIDEEILMSSIRAIVAANAGGT